MRSRLLAPLVVLALVAVGCGDDDAEPQSTGETSSTTADDDTTDTSAEPSTTTTSTVPDAEAEDAPGESGGEDEGLGDAFVYVAELSGGSEVPGPGDDAGSGRAELRSSDDGLCIDMVVRGVDSEVTDAHIHEGAAGESGGVVIPIGPPTASEGDTNTWTEVCVPVDDELVHRFEVDASRFYANVHTTSFPDGAVRGQLDYATIFDLELS
jgi:hypothetical protein